VPDTQAIVIRVDDEVTWPNQIPLANRTGRVVEVGYESVTLLEHGRDLSHAVFVELAEVRVRVRTPRLQAGDIVVLAPTAECPVYGTLQGVVQPVRWRDGLGGYLVEWEHCYGRSRHRPAELERVPIPDQHPQLWPAAAGAAN
jgi:hypothetical protein